MARRASNSRTRRTARRALDKRLDVVREILPAVVMPHGGWIRAIREAIGMTAGELGARMGSQESTVLRMEGSEAGDRIQLGTLRRAAVALDCDLAYALVPRRPLEQMVDQQAVRLAARLIAGVDHSMSLEDQRVAAETTANQVREYADRLVDLSGLWREVP